jgi:hypothetical protein
MDALHSPLFYQAVLLTSATTSGLNLIVPSLVSSTAGAATGFLITSTRRLKWPVLSGAILYVVGCLVLTLSMRRTLPSWVYPLCLVPISLGQGFQFPGTVMAILATSEQAEQAVVTSTLSLWRGLGMVLGVATSSLVVQNALARYLDMYVTGEETEKRDVIERVRKSVEAISGLSPQYREQVVMSYEAALRLTFAFCTALSVVSLLVILPIKLPRLGARK